jgi:choline kinase|tara:strand:+ start:2106 stop:2807 length:702 start_codon:yes stop_codon:yes gene_type:complete
MAKHKIKAEEKDTLTVIIPAAGEGRRMKSYGPKSLIELGKSNILQRQIRIVEKVLGSVEFIIVAGFECDKLMDSCPEYFIKLENENYSITNVSRSLSIALRSVKTERVLIIYGDLVFNEQALSKMDFSTSSTSASLDQERNNEVGCIFDNEKNIVNMMYDLETKWNQIIYLQGRELEIFKKECQNRSNKKKFGFEIINKVVDAGGKIKCIVDKSISVVDIDTSKDLIRANNIK